MTNRCVTVCCGALAVSLALVGTACSTNEDASLGPRKIAVELGGGPFAMTFVRSDPGSFTMGNENGNDDERRVHNVAISRRFYIGRQKVTGLQWLAGGYDRATIYRVSPTDAMLTTWTECQEYLSKLNERYKGKLLFRLPTEAEWEYVCRAAGPARQSGEQEDDWCVRDMMSGPWEWCGDWYGPYGGDHQVDPAGPATGSRRVVRGGSKADGPATRHSLLPGDHRTGFRVVIVPLSDSAIAERVVTLPTRSVIPRAPCPDYLLEESHSQDAAYLKASKPPEPITDGKPPEPRALFWFLNKAGAMSAEELKGSARAVSSAELTSRIGQYRGVPIALMGTLWNVVRIELPKNPLGLKEVFHGQILDRDRAMWTFWVVEQPDAPGGRGVASLIGFVMKRWDYTSKAGKVVRSPVIVGRSMELLQLE